MSDIQFEDGQKTFSQNNYQNNTSSKMINFLIKKGIVKNAESAFRVLLAIAVIFIGLSIYFFWSAYRATYISPDDPRFRLSEEQIMTFPPEIQEQIRNNQNQ